MMSVLVNYMFKRLKDEEVVLLTSASARKATATQSNV